MTQLVGDLLKKNYRLSFGFVVNQPTPPPLPSFFVAVNESLLGDNCILWCYFPRNLWLAFNISTWQNFVFVIYITQVF